MPKLSELTDYQPEPQVTPQGRLYVSPNMPTSDDGDYFTKPVVPMPELGSNNVVERIIKKLAETEFSPGTDAGNKLAGTGGQERYQLWPEKIVRSALTAIPDAYSGKIPMHDVDPETGELVPSQAMIGRAMDMASFAGAGGIAGTGEGGVALGAGPSLRPALKYKDRLYKGKEGQQHQDVIPPHLYPEFQDMAMKGEDISHYNFGFVNDKGHFLSREDALKYGVDTGLIDPQAEKYGALTSTLLADSSKPGIALEATAKTAQPFFSALEHNVSQINQSKMNGEAWLGTLANKPGVKPEELDWTGLKSFLEENKGKPVTKEQVQEHLQNNKVELKEVSKGKLDDPLAKDLLDILGSKSIDWLKTPEDIAIAKKFNANFNETTKGLSDETILKSAEKARASKDLGDSKYHDYQLPGGENYREMLMTLPNKQQRHYEWEYFDPKTSTSKQFKTEAEAKAAAPEGAVVNPKEISTTNEAYRSSHWDEPNILAHVRMNDRTIDGKKSLHLEEIQSDWHQQGRDKGYSSGENIHDLNKKELPALEQAWLKASSNKYKNYSEAMAANESGPAFLEMQKKVGSDPEVVSIRKRINDARDGVPDAPFKKTWHELALKRMLREAAEKGYDRLSWTPGEAQAARYDLSKQIDQIKYIKNPDGTYNVVPFKNNSPMHAVERESVKPEELSNIVGKEVAQKITKGEGKKEGDIGVLEGLDLKIGGEGMKGFYDQIIPKALSKISGEKIKYAELPGKLSNRMGQPPETHPVHYIDIPQSLKDRAMQKGFPLFSGKYMFTPISGDPFKD